MVHVVVDRKGHAGVGAIDGAGRGKDQVLDVTVPAPLKNVQETHNVGVNVRMGVFQGIANARLGRQVHNRVKFLSGKEVLHGRPVSQVYVDVGEGRVRGQPIQTGLFRFGS